MDHIKSLLQLTDDNEYADTSSGTDDVVSIAISWCKRNDKRYNKYVMNQILSILRKYLCDNKQLLGDLIFEQHKKILIHEHMGNMWSIVNMYYLRMIDELSITYDHLKHLDDPDVIDKLTVMLLMKERDR